tara:strand:+ start:623 stop:865 length:243 start_codon:yes stop_codon:yes gene_type:complete
MIKNILKTIENFETIKIEFNIKLSQIIDSNNICIKKCLFKNNNNCEKEKNKFQRPEPLIIPDDIEIKPGPLGPNKEKTIC